MSTVPGLVGYFLLGIEITPWSLVGSGVLGAGIVGCIVWAVCVRGARSKVVKQDPPSDN